MIGTTVKNRHIFLSVNSHRSRRFSALLTTLVFAILLSMGAAPAAAQPSSITGTNVQKLANGLLTLMGYSLVPDVTTGSLSFSNASTGNPGLSMTSLGAGFTVSKDVPLYLEGTAAYSRYDPTFLVSDGTNSREVPVKWNSLSATAGIGWDFPIIQDLVLRPIFNFTLGTIQSDLKIAGQYLGNQTGRDLSFLDRGRLDAAGIGGSLMLDYERYRPEQRDRRRVALYEHLPPEHQRLVGGRFGECRRADPEPLVPVARADRPDRAREAGAVRPRILAHAIPRRSSRRDGFRLAHVAGCRP